MVRALPSHQCGPGLIPARCLSVKSTVQEPRFFKLTFVCPFINGVYCEIMLPRFLIRFLISVLKKTACTHGCGLYITVLWFYKNAL